MKSTYDNDIWKLAFQAKNSYSIFFLIWIRIKLFLEFLLTDLEAAVAYSSNDSDKYEVSELVDKGAVWFTFSFHSATT